MTEQQLRQTQQYILDKLDDFENQSRGNNLRVIGLPKSFNSDSLQDICTSDIPSTLGITSLCIVERAHRMETPSNEERTPQPVIVSYLDYTDRVNVLKSFRNSKSLQIDGFKLLLLVDYSQEVSRRWKAFQPICAALYQKGVKFTLAYPAIQFHRPLRGSEILFPSRRSDA